MFFNRKQKSVSVQKYRADKWDDRLYQSLFSKTRSANPYHIYYFSCILTQRICKIDSTYSFAANNEYHGLLHQWLNDNECCDIPITLNIDENEADEDSFINTFHLGYMLFSQGSYGLSGHPELAITLRNQKKVGENISSLFSQTKSNGGNGIEIFWSIALNNIKELNAEKAWGDGKDSSRFDSKGNLIDPPPPPPGLKPFPIECISFHAEL